MLHALIPARRSDKTRFQVLVEINYRNGHPLRPLALRACSGQSFLKQLVPSRYASVATKALLQMLPGLFHITLRSNHTNIVAKGQTWLHDDYTWADGRTFQFFSTTRPVQRDDAGQVEVNCEIR